MMPAAALVVDPPLVLYTEQTLETRDKELR